MVAMVKGWGGVLVVCTTAQGGLVTRAGSEGVGRINLAPEGNQRGFSAVAQISTLLRLRNK